MASTTHPGHDGFWRAPPATAGHVASDPPVPVMSGASVAVLGAAGYAGAIAAQILYKHPHFELTHVTARAGGGPAARRRAPAHARTAGARGVDGGEQTADAAVVAYPGARRRRSSRSCAAAACASWICPRTSGCTIAAIYKEWYGEHDAPDCMGQAVYGLPELTASRSPGRPRRRPGLLPTAALLGLAPLARAG